MNFLKHVIYENKFKVFIIILLALAISIFNIVDPSSTQYDIITSYESDGKYYYNYEDDGDYKIAEFDEKVQTCYITIVNDNFHKFLMGLCGVCILILFIPVLSDDDPTWDFEKCWNLSLYDKIESFYEDGNYFYRLDGKLLLATSYKESKNGIIREIKEYRKDPTTYPSYDGPLSHRRSKAIDAILIKKN